MQRQVSLMQYGPIENRVRQMQPAQLDQLMGLDVPIHVQSLKLELAISLQLEYC
jgi:hypothetical protein